MMYVFLLWVAVNGNYLPLYAVPNLTQAQCWYLRGTLSREDKTAAGMCVPQFVEERQVGESNEGGGMRRGDNHVPKRQPVQQTQ